MLLKALAIAGWTAILSGLPVQAQTKDALAGPREVPPASFRDAQYVDSRGCIFVRAAIGGRTNWVAQLSADRKPLCGLPPTFAVKEAATSVPPKQKTARSKSAAKPVARSATRIEVTPAAQPRRIGLKGYRPAWKDGRLNPLRGVGTEEGQAAQDRIWTRDVPAKLIEQADASGVDVVTAASNRPTAQIYVQVGLFGQPANAKGATRRLSQLGLPVATAKARRGNAVLQAVLAGPFNNTSQANAALRAARQSGFADAFIR